MPGHLGGLVTRQNENPDGAVGGLDFAGDPRAASPECGTPDPHATPTRLISLAFLGNHQGTRCGELSPALSGASSTPQLQ